MPRAARIVGRGERLPGLRCTLVASARRAGLLVSGPCGTAHRSPVHSVNRLDRAMPTNQTGSCQHERRPGTVVCLYCRHEQHMAEVGRQRSRQMVVGGVLAVVVAVGVWGPFRQAGEEAGAATTASTSIVPPASAIETRADALVEAPPAVGVASAATVPDRSPVPRPIVAPGRTSLGDGAVAVRSGDTVAVHFDTPEARTRRPEKFERIVRSTLPAIYGAAADSALAAVPQGMLASGGDLLTALPEQGVRIPTSDGGALMLWPETRPGRDGPLVVTYRATVVR